MWKRRQILGAFGLGTASMALAAVPNTSAAQSVEDDSKHANMTKSCCDVCSDCARACNTAFRHCMEQVAAGRARHAKVAQIVADCASFCALSAQMMARQSPLMTFSCRACADACQRCAQECGSVASDAEMKSCVDACQRCEESCRNMVKAMGGRS